MRKLVFTVDSSIRVRRFALKEARVSVRELREVFSYPNPDFFKKSRMGYYTGDTPREISLVEADDEELRLPRGGVLRLREFLEREGVGFEFLDQRVLGRPLPPGTAYVAPFRLDPDQRSAIKAAVRGKNGVIIGPCASGKTEIGIAAIAELGRRAIVVVPTERILGSWVEKARARLPGVSVGALYGKRKEPDADVVVGLPITVRNTARDDRKWAGSFGTLYVDEAHHVAASTWGETVALFPATNRLATTATVERKDGKAPLFYDAVGSISRTKRTGTEGVAPRVLFRITDADLERFGRIMPVEVVVVPTDFEFDLHLERHLIDIGWEREPRESALASVRRWAKETAFDGSTNTYAEMLDEMARDRHRLARILEYLLPEVSAGNPSLLLADRREFCFALAKWLGRRRVEVGKLMGGKQKKEADRTERRIREGDLLVAVGTSIADEGMDVGPLSRGFGCTPAASNPGRITQQFGRIKRLAEGKENARYFYFWDERVLGLRGHLRAIFRAVKSPHSVSYSRKPGERIPLTSRIVREIELGEL